MSALSYFFQPSTHFFDVDRAFFNWPQPSPYFHSRRRRVFPTVNDFFEEAYPTVFLMEWNPSTETSDEPQPQQPKQQEEASNPKAAAAESGVSSTPSNSSPSEPSAAAPAAPSTIPSASADVPASSSESRAADVQQPAASQPQLQDEAATQVSNKKTKSALSLWREEFEPLFVRGLRWDVVEKEAQFEVTADVPGIAKDDIKLEVNGNVLTVTAERKKESTDESSGKYRRLERTYGKVQRSLRLPHGVLANQISAKHENGVLTISFPKSTQPEVQQVQIA